MHYQDERTDGCRISDSWTYRGLKTVILENELIRVVVLADKGADIYSFVHKASDTDFMWRSPSGVRDPRRFLPTSGSAESVWLDVYEGGWQTVVPHGGYPSSSTGAELGLHAEMNTLPWDVQIVEDTRERVAARFSARGPRTPFFVEKTLSISAGEAILTVDESVVNEAEEPANCVWLEHIAIGEPFLSPDCRLDVAESRIINHGEKVEPNSVLEPGFEGPWPLSRAVDGSEVDFRTFPGKETRAVDMAYMTGQSEGWYAVTNEKTGVGFALSYPAEVFKYLWYWRSFGAFGYPWYGRTYNVGLEPCTSFDNGGMDSALENGSVRRFEAGETVSATIKAIAFRGTGEVARVAPEGIIEWA
ncbi:MAG: DUF4432 family protein [Chloroflexi bacterium]|nr:DUF4432 family protein [Chloroflexota bacterium]MCH8222492.1 DUF4432 family protein [Chloroflexota bacterium]